MRNGTAGQTGDTGGFFWEGQGFVVAFLLLTLVALLRGQVTYWVARVVTEQTLRHTAPTTGWRAGVHAWLGGEGVARGRTSLQRWGLVMVPLSYLTVGFQTLVLAAAGLIRIPWLRFSLAQLPGAAAWGLIYSTIGFAVWGAAIAALAGEPLAVAALAALLLVAVTTVLLGRRRRESLRVETGSYER
jgi:membrane protein DedA with SNARE-associated domain